MTRSRKLKKIIRQRARKTGERYTAARRQVLLAREGRGATAPPAAAKKKTPRRSATGGALSAATALARTGHTLDHWFAVLDAFGAAAKGHTAAARHLYEVHGVPGWHAQGLTVAYERARGVRAMNQACDGRFKVSVSRVVAGSVDEVARALTDRAERARWLRGADALLVGALDAAFRGPEPREVKRKDAGNARLRYRWDGSTVEIRITGKPSGGASVVADNINLSGTEEVERRRAAWKVALDGLREYLSA
jgi:hypothetical protein